MSRKGSQRTKKVPATFKDYVSADVQERPMLEEENWYLVQFEDEGQLFSVLPPEKVRHISPADMHEDISEGDYVDAEWPADGKEYDAKVVKIGPKTEMRKLRTTLEKERSAKDKGPANVKDTCSRPTTSTVTKPKATVRPKAASKHSKDEDKEAKKKKREENKQKRLEMERKRKAELAQAKDNVKYFAGQHPPLPTLVTPDETPLQPLNFPSDDDQESTRLPCLPVRRTLLPSPPKKPRLDIDSALEILSSDDESDDGEGVPPHPALTAVHQTCPTCPTLKQNILKLQEKVMALKGKLKETKKQLQDKESENADKMVDSGDQKHAEHLTAGVVSPETAKKSGMVPLVPGSSVFLYQEQKNACFDCKPTVLVRNLMRVFFKDEVLKASNYGGGGPRGYTKLDPAITTAIIGYAMDPQIIKPENRVSQAELAKPS